MTLYDFHLCIPKYLDISYSKIWILIQFQDFFIKSFIFLKEIQCQVSAFRTGIKISDNITIPYYKESSDVFRSSSNALEV